MIHAAKFSVDPAWKLILNDLGVNANELLRRADLPEDLFSRKKLALHYLANSACSGAEISFLLGFADPNSFVRAFRAWTGKTPKKVRAEMVA